VSLTGTGPWVRVGIIPSSVMDELWPGFEPNSLEIHLSEAALLAHFDNKKNDTDRDGRVYHLGLHRRHISEQFASPLVYVKYEKVTSREAGISLFLPPMPHAGCNYLVVGIHVVMRGREHPGHVATVIPPVKERDLFKRMAKCDYVLGRTRLAVDLGMKFERWQERH